MADAKFVTVFVIMASVFVMIFASQMCELTTRINGQSMPISFLYNMSTFQPFGNQPQSCQNGQQYAIDENTPTQQAGFVGAAGQLTNLSSGSVSQFGTSAFIDPLKLVSGAIGIIGLFLGIPFFSFLFVIGIPYPIAVILSVFLSVMNIVGIAEFLRGGWL